MGDIKLYNLKVRYKHVNNLSYVDEILQLQKENLPTALDPKEIANQGFLTIQHSAEDLIAMNSPYAHVIATDGEKLAGYCLVMTLEHSHRFPVIRHMFERLVHLDYKGRDINSMGYFIMGQVCVAKAYRGKGVFRGMYGKLREFMAPHFDLCITEVSTTNQRSLRAHLNIGFEVIKSYKDDQGHPWEIVAWDWTTDG